RSGARDVEAAVRAAQTAFLKWREVPPVVRARYLFKLKYLMEEHFDDIATTGTREHGKALDEARGSVRRGIENVEHACGIPALMMGKTLEDVASGIDCEYVRQPLGVFAAITPFNFPAMVPCWFWPYAIATGNTFILKPSEQVPFSSTRILELAHEAGIPAGVLTLVPGGKAYEPFRDKLLSAAKDLRLGYGLEPDVNMGPVISAKHKEKVLSYVEAGRKEGATLLLDGRTTKVEKHPRGHFVGPTVFDGVQPDMTIGKEEIFGPVAAVTHVSNLDEGIEMVRASGFANATSIFTQSVKAASEFRY